MPHYLVPEEVPTQPRKDTSRSVRHALWQG